MTRAKDRDEDMVSIASSNHSRKRKKAVSPPSDSSNSDVPVTKSKSKYKNKLDSDTSTDRQKGKRSSHLTDGTKPSAAKKGKSAKHATTDSDDDSDEDIVVVASSSKASQSASYKRSSPSKPSYKYRDEKKLSLKDRRLSQAASDNDDEMASRTSSHKSAKTTSSKASTSSFSKQSHLSGLSSHKSARDSLKSEQVQLPFRKFSDIFGDHNFAPAKSVSPAKAHNDFHAVETSQDAIKIKRLQGQNETLKRKFDESEDRFNEASSRSEELQAQVKQLEYQIKTMEKRHDENVARVKERFVGSGDSERATQARIEELEHNFSIATNKHVEVTLALHAELRRVQRELDAARGNDIAPRQPAWMRKAEMESTRRADELEAQLKQQKLDFENKIESLESELALQQVNPQLAAKEREIEAVRLAFTRELEKKDDALKTLRTMYNMDRQAWSAYGQTTGSSSGLPAFQDVERLQKIVTAQDKQLKDADLRLQAVADTYEARIKQMDHIARELLRKNRRELEDLENSRSSMEFDRSRFQGQVASLKREREQQDSVITELRKFRLDYDRLRAEHPVLQKKYDQLLESKNLVYAENENLKRERLLMHAQNQQRQSKMDEYAALLQAGQLQVATPSDLLEKYKLLKSTYSMEREKYKRKIKKLERKLSIVQGAPVYGHLDGNSLSNGMSATPATSASEEESSHSQARANRRYSTQEHADLGDTLFNDTISSEVSLRPAKRISPRSPSPFEVLPSKSLAYERLSEQVGMVQQSKRAQLEAYEQAKPSYQFPPTIRERKADTKVPRHHNRVYVRSECHTPYVPDEVVSDSDDEFLEWESQAYAKSQAGNPDRQAAVVNTCWNRHILDIRCNRVRSSNLHFCIEFVESYGPLIHSREATPALLKHILKLVDLGQLTADEGGTVIRSYHQAV